MHRRSGDLKCPLYFGVGVALRLNKFTTTFHLFFSQPSCNGALSFSERALILLMTRLIKNMIASGWPTNGKSGNFEITL
jgi:hypothetical protein